MSTSSSPLPPSTSHVLAAALALASRSLHEQHVCSAARCEELERLEREAQTWLHRVASYKERDCAIYRTGAAFEPRGGHLLDDIQLSGLDALGMHGLLAFVEVWLDQPSSSLSEGMLNLFASRYGALVREWGIWARRMWNAALYVAEVEEFLQSKMGRDLKARWRTRPVTRRQVYLIEEIARQKQLLVPVFANRGEAFDWIGGQGGNPRYWEQPVMPPLPRTRFSA